MVQKYYISRGIRETFDIVYVTCIFIYSFPSFFYLSFYYHYLYKI